MLVFDLLLALLILGLAWANTGAATAAEPATAPSVAFLMNERRCIVKSSLALMV